jgi:DNA-binding MarR family transcriptional regulator
MAQHEKTSVISIQKRESRSSTIELELELSRVLARVLSACYSPKTLSDLQRSLGVEQSSLSRFVAFLNLHGFLESSSTADDTAFKQTEQGARLLYAFVTLYRSASDGQASRRGYKTSQAHYAPCLNCARHTLYPETPPITLHVDGQCQLCHNSSK